MTYDGDVEVQTRQLATIENTMQACIAECRAVEKQIEDCRQQLIEATDHHNEIQGQYYQLGSDISTRETSMPLDRRKPRANSAVPA